MASLSPAITRGMSAQLDRANGNGVHAPARPTPIDSGKCEMRLSLIRVNGGTQSRAEIDWAYVGELIEALESQTLLPAIDVYFDGQEYWLADGFHRYEAHKKLNYPNIFANVHQGTRWNAVLHSVGSNATHGKRRTNADKNRAVKLMLTAPEAAKMSNREIAKACKVSHQFVNDLQTDLKIERQFGKSYPRDVATVAIKHKIQHREVMDEVEQLYENGRETFNVIRDTGWIQPDDEENAVHISDKPAKVKKALRQIVQNHKIVGAQASDKPYTAPTPPAPVASEPTDTRPVYTFDIPSNAAPFALVVTATNLTEIEVAILQRRLQLKCAVFESERKNGKLDPNELNKDPNQPKKTRKAKAS